MNLFAFLRVITRALSKTLQLRNDLASKVFTCTITLVNDQCEKRASLGIEIQSLEVFLVAPVKKSSCEKKDACLPSYSGWCPREFWPVLWCFVFSFFYRNFSLLQLAINFLQNFLMNHQVIIKKTDPFK